MGRKLRGKVVIATHNPGKLKEMRELLLPHGIETISAGDLGLDEPIEIGTSFSENAIIKATAATNASQPAGARRRFGACGRSAWRRARDSLGALGRREKRFRARHADG